MKFLGNKFISDFSIDISNYHLSKILVFLTYIIITNISCSKNSNNNPNQSFRSEVPSPIQVTKSNPVKILMHYMPWFETNESNNGSWGLHWTMAVSNPNIIDTLTGKRQIASFYYPLIGPYHSGDSSVIEYHLLLMKYSGVDVVVIDWGGVHDIDDYKINFDNTDKLIQRTKDVGIDFGIVYEPIVTSIVENATGQSKISAAIDDFKFLKQNYFNQFNYWKSNKEIPLLVFGNNFTGYEWKSIFNSADIYPKLYFLQFLTKLDNLTNIIPVPGEFFWVNPSDYNGQTYWDGNFSGVKIGGAYPGFKDYYLEGGWINSHLNWEINLSTNTLKDRLNFLKSFKFNVVQIQTFNDFGEGTMLEPTFEFGFSFLNELQQFSGVPYTTKELNLIYKYYLLRTKLKSKISIAEAKNIFVYLSSLNVIEAEKLINKYF